MLTSALIKHPQFNTLIVHDTFTGSYLQAMFEQVFDTATKKSQMKFIEMRGNQLSGYQEVFQYLIKPQGEHSQLSAFCGIERLSLTQLPFASSEELLVKFPNLKKIKLALLNKDCSLLTVQQKAQQSEQSEQQQEQQATNLLVLHHHYTCIFKWLGIDVNKRIIEPYELLYEFKFQFLVPITTGSANGKLFRKIQVEFVKKTDYPTRYKFRIEFL